DGLVPDDCALVVLTSGSTANPKQVTLSANALVASARATAEAIGIGRWVLALPLTYIAGLMVVVRSIESGTELVSYYESTFDPESFVTLVNALPEDTWFTSLVPAQLARLVDHAEASEDSVAALTKFRAILVGGQAIPTGLVDRATALGANVIRTYGSAETAGGVVYDGIPIGDTELRIAEDGVLEIRSSSLANGYLGDDIRTRETFVNGWYRTSDIAHLDNGRLVIDGRVDDIIVTGGVKVSLADIERVLAARGISAVASWYPDDQWGQVPALVSTDNLDRDEVRAIIADELGKAARPYRIVLVETVPMLSSGKVDRAAVREIVLNSRP
ncbi:MAG: hypothetical protein RLZZ40_1026, partial [Actinomycetota bacterium]